MYFWIFALAFYFYFMEDHKSDNPSIKLVGNIARVILILSIIWIIGILIYYGVFN